MLRDILGKTSIVLCALLFVGSPRGGYGHGFDVFIQELPDTNPAVKIDETVYTVGELKLLVSLRTGPYRRAESIMFGVGDLLEAAIQDPVYTLLAREGVESGVSLGTAEVESIDSQTRAFARRQLFRDAILANTITPSLEDLRSLYEAEKETRFRTDERFVIREIVVAGGDAENPPPEILNAFGRLQNGENFVNVAASTKGQAAPLSAVVVDGKSERKLTQQDIEKFHTLSNRTFSEPYLADESWKILYRQLHVPGGYIAFESLLSPLNDYAIQLQQERLIGEFLSDLAKDTSRFTIHGMNLMQEGDLAIDKDVMITISGRDITRGELINYGGWSFAKDARVNESAFRERALQTGLVQNLLIDSIIDERGYLDRTEVRFFREKLQETLLTRKFILQSANAADTPPTDSEILRYFRRLELMTARGNDIVDYDTVTISDEEFSDEVRDSLADVKTREQFQAWTTAINTEHRWEQIVTFSQAPPEIFDALLGESLPGIVGPLSVDGTTTLHWIDTASIRFLPTNVERDRLLSIVADEKRQDIIEAALSGYTASIVYQSYLPTE